MNWKNIAKVGVSALLAAGLLVGCSSGTSTGSDTSTSTGTTENTSGGSDASGKTIGVLVVTSQSQWCNDIVAGVTAIADENGAKVIVSDSQVSVDNEMSGMERFTLSHFVLA